MFEVVDSSHQQANEPRINLERVKEAYVNDHTFLTSTNEKIFGLEKYLKFIKKVRDSLLSANESMENSYNTKLSQDEKDSQAQINHFMVELKDEHMNDLLSDDMGFEKAKAQVLCLYPNLDLSEMDFFKEVVDGRLVVEIDLGPPKAKRAFDLCCLQ